MPSEKSRNLPFSSQLWVNSEQNSVGNHSKWKKTLNSKQLDSALKKTYLVTHLEKSGKIHMWNYVTMKSALNNPTKVVKPIRQYPTSLLNIMLIGWIQLLMQFFLHTLLERRENRTRLIKWPSTNIVLSNGDVSLVLVRSRNRCGLIHNGRLLRNPIEFDVLLGLGGVIWSNVLLH